MRHVSWNEAQAYCALGRSGACPRRRNGSAPAPASSTGRSGSGPRAPSSPIRASCADPYKDYSQPWFGTHKVLRGGEFRHARAPARPTFRNFYTPDRADVFCGFRTCALAAGIGLGGAHLLFPEQRRERLPDVLQHRRLRGRGRMDAVGLEEFGLLAEALEQVRQQRGAVAASRARRRRARRPACRLRRSSAACACRPAAPWRRFSAPARSCRRGSSSSPRPAGRAGRRCRPARGSRSRAGGVPAPCRCAPGRRPWFRPRCSRWRRYNRGARAAAAARAGPPSRCCSGMPYAADRLSP